MLCIIYVYNVFQSGQGAPLNLQGLGLGGQGSIEQVSNQVVGCLAYLV